MLYDTSLNVPALPLLQRFGRLGPYVHRLPVITEEARWGGVEGYGFPEIVADINFADLGEVCRCTVRADGRDVIELEVKKSATKPRRTDY